nr:ribonuclease H-like domain-containing protein [Tanacetum cinerariifolium]
MTQHTPVQLQFSPTVVSDQTTTVSDQHASAIIQNSPVNPNPDSVHPMVTCFRVGTNRPTKRLNLHVSSVSPLPKSYRDAFNDPNWQNAMRDKYTAFIKNQTWTLEPYLSALKWILHYVCGTLDYSLQLFSYSTTDLVAYSNADWASCLTTRRSTSGYCVFLGNNLLSWSSKRQPTLSRSSAEAEYRGFANAVAETCWLRNLLRELHTPLSSATLVYCDNVRVLHVLSRYQFTDIFTKGLSSALFEEFRSSLSVRCTPAQIVREC